MSKPLLKSKTIHGLLVVFAGVFINIAVSNGWVGNAESKELIDAIGMLAEFLGLTYAGYGRIKTDGKQLTLK